MTTIIKAKRLIDGTGAPPQVDMALVASEGKILQILPQEEVEPTPDQRVVEVVNGTILPGFIDMHVHLTCTGSADPKRDCLADSDEVLLLRTVANAQALLRTGVTTTRDCGGKARVLLALRQAIEQGLLDGPRLAVSGDVITTTGGHCYYFGLEADSAHEVRKGARTLVKAGVDFLKVMATGGGMTPGTNMRAAQYGVDELKALVEEGHRLNKHVAAHCHATQGIRNAAAAGVTTIEHVTWLGPDDGFLYDEAAADLMVRNHVYASPTNPTACRRMNKAKAAGDLMAWNEQYALYQARCENWRRMLAQGVRFVAGTDAGATNMAFDDYVLSLELMVKDLGMTPMQAILSGTRVPAEVLGLGDRIGTLAPGKQADVVVVEGDPLADIATLYQVKAVFKGGKRLV
jgi:imidazolonepropionase-like amidohydrolase